MTRRILIVEDEMTIAMMVEDMVEALGHAIAGVAYRLGQALELAEGVEADIAILDLNLDGHSSLPVADLLAARGIGIVFASGYGARGVPERFADRPVLAKPYLIRDLGAAIDRVPLLAPMPRISASRT